MGDNFIPVKRPKPSDGEEDILRMQEEFLVQKLSPCAKVINLRSKEENEQQPPKKQSIFAKRRAESTKKRISTSQGCGNITNEGMVYIINVKFILKLE